MRQAFACRKLFSLRTLAARESRLLEIVKRQDSLKRKKEFRYTYRVGKSQPGKVCALVYAKNRNHSAKIGFSVSKKIGNSVTRNRVKRRMREAVTPLIPRLIPGYNMIFIARQQILDAPFERICETMRTQLDRAQLLDGSKS